MLAGSLREFSLRDVLRFLAATDKSGTLHVRGDGCEGFVSLASGEVATAVADVRRPPAPLPLLAVSALEGTDLQRHQNAWRAGDREAVTSLLQGLAATNPSVERFLRHQLYDTVCNLMRWTEGQFEFAADDGVTGGMSVPVEEIVTEASRLLDGWAASRARIPSNDLIVALRLDSGSSLTFSVEDWMVVVLVDGSRTVADLAVLTGLGEAATVQVLADLAERDLVEVLPQGSKPALEAMVSTWEAVRAGEATVAELPTPTPMPPTPTPTREPVEVAVGGNAPGSAPRPSSAVPEEPAPLPAFVSEAVQPPAPAVADGSSPPLPDLPDLIAAVAPAAAESGSPPEGPAAPASPTSAIDRAQIARELASLGLDLEATRPAGGVGAGLQGALQSAATRPAAAAANGRPGPKPAVTGMAPGRALNGHGGPKANGSSPSPSTNGHGGANGHGPSTGGGPALGRGGGLSHGLGGGSPQGQGAVKATPAQRPSSPAASRDDDVSKGLLLRLLEGVRGT